MRFALLAVGMLLLLSTLVQAYTITSTNTVGIQPVVYGETIAFVTFEDAVDKDLTTDGDQSDYVIQYYDLREDKTTNTGQEGMHLAIFGRWLAFEDDARMIRLYDIDDRKVVETHARGTNPSIDGTRAAFATSEKDTSLDLNGDGDLRDVVIRYYTIGGSATTNTKAVGEYPAVVGDRIVFGTSEDLADADLNKDGDLDDTIIRYYDLDEENVINTRTTGTRPTGFEGNTVVITDSKQLWTLDLETLTHEPLGIAGNDPSVFKGVLVYERNGTLFTLRLSTGVEKALGIAGTDPALFEDTLVFVAEDKTVTILKGDDPDQDDIPDFADNCPDKSNEDQLDNDQDGLGNACDQTPEPVAAQAPAEPRPEEQDETPAPPAVETAPAPAVTAQAVKEQPPAPATAERKDIPQAVALEQEKGEKGPTYWFLIAVGLMVIGMLVYFFVPRWLQKRRKSFGF